MWELSYHFGWVIVQSHSPDISTTLYDIGQWAIVSGIHYMLVYRTTYTTVYSVAILYLITYVCFFWVVWLSQAQLLELLPWMSGKNTLIITMRYLIVSQWQLFLKKKGMKRHKHTTKNVRHPLLCKLHFKKTSRKTGIDRFDHGAIIQCIIYTGTSLSIFLHF